MRTSSWLLLALLMGLSACASVRNVVLVSDPLSCEEHAELGTSYAEQKMTGEAEKEFRAGLRKKKDCTSVQAAMEANNLAMVLLTENKDLDEARRLARAALEDAGPARPYVLDTLAEIDAKTGRISEARLALDHADMIAPANDKALLNQLADTRKKLPELPKTHPL